MNSIKKTKNKEGLGAEETKENFDAENNGVRPMALTVKIVVLNSEHKLLLLKRSKKCLNPKKWDLPGGHIDENESIVDTIKREALEETGLSVEIGPIINVVEFDKSHKAFKEEKRGLRYIAMTTDFEVKLNKDEHSEFKWLSFDEAITLLEDEGFEAEKKQTIKAAKNRMELEKALSGWHRTLADFDNFKKRTEKANNEFRKFCLESLVMELLPVIDNFEMATEHIPSEQQEQGWVVGVMHIKNQLLGVLESNGVKEILVKKGDEIDEKIHEILKVSEKMDLQEMKVKKVIKKGYKMGEKVIRPATIEVA